MKPGKGGNITYIGSIEVVTGTPMSDLAGVKQLSMFTALHCMSYYENGN